MKIKLLPVFMTLTVLLLLALSLSSVEACHDGDENDVVYDCESWSTDDTMVNLGVSSWSLLDGTAKVTAYKINCGLNCNCCTCCDGCGLCACCDDCCVDPQGCLEYGILTHRGTRGLGVLGGSNNDEIDVVGKSESIVVAFNEPRVLCSFEVRSLFNESYHGEQVFEECDVALLLDCVVVQKYHLAGEELIGTGNGIISVLGINQCFDCIVFYVDRTQSYSAYSDFAVAKIKTSEDEISFVQPIVGVDCDNEENQPPVANDDSYIVAEGGILNVMEAKGVLLNDTDDNGDSLTAIKTSDPSNGMLLFNSNGSFTYTPYEGFSGIDSFTYKANDGEDDSNEAVVTITVTDVMPSIIVTKTACPTVVTEPGDNVEFTVEVCNTGVEPVTLVSLIDDIFGDLNGQGDCVIPQTIPVDGSYLCSFTAMISGEAEHIHQNTVTAIVMDDEENSACENDSAIVIIAICEECNILPVADTGGPYVGYEDEAISFNGSESYDLDGIIVNYTWDFGDETPLEYGVEITHIYANAGAYTVNLTVKDDDDAIDVNSTIVTVNEKNDNSNNGNSKPTGGGRTIYIPDSEEKNQPPIADASAGEPYEAVVDEEITFDGSNSYDPDGEIVEWFWDFGDDTFGTGEVITHSYPDAGIYSVELLVTDEKGANDYYGTIVVISMPNRPPSDPDVIAESLIYEPEDGIWEGAVNIDYMFNVSSTDPDDDDILYIVDWGDGTINETSLLPNGTIATFYHKWESPGIYMVNVTAKDENNASSEKTSLKVKIDVKDEAEKKVDYSSWWLLFLTILLAGVILASFFRWKKKNNLKGEEEKMDGEI